MRTPSRLPPEQIAPHLLETPHPRSPAFRALADAPAEPVDWPVLYGNANPVEIEVGFGKGMFLVNQGTLRPAVNFLGLEIERKYTLHTATRLAKRALSNVRVASTDAKWFLAKRVADQSVEAMHVYFPDPWWKHRHRKRRLFTEDFVQSCVRVLRVGGRLHFVTDVLDYYTESLEIVAKVTALNRIEFPELSADEYLTNFEKKYREEGRPIHRALFERIA